MKSKFPSVDIAKNDLVLDASVLINLLGTGIPKRILSCFQGRAWIEEHTFGEVTRHPISGVDLKHELDALVRNGLLKRGAMSADAFNVFLDLAANDIVGGLDDGEAASIAYAISFSSTAIVVIDERKATRIFSQRWPHRTLIDTVTLLAQDCISRELEDEEFANACFSALRYARMRVTEDAAPWIAEVIGNERAAQCPSLRPYR